MSRGSHPLNERVNAAPSPVCRASYVLVRQNEHPARMLVPSSGESHQQDELSPVNKVEPERGTPLAL